MKKIFYILFAASLFMVMFAFNSCRKEVSPLTESSSNPKVDMVSPESGASNTVVTVTGSGLGDMRSVIFETDSIPTPLSPTLNTEGALIFRVPNDATPGLQNIIFTNGEGKSVSVAFTVLGVPVVSSVSDYNYTPGQQITLTGRNLADVTEVVLSGTTEEVTIVSQTLTTLVIAMPATDRPRTKLNITNPASTLTTTQEFVNVDHAFAFFTDDYGDGWSNGSWGPATISTTVFKRGTASFAATYQKGNWSADGFANWWPGLDYSADYQFLTFWIKGGSTDHTLYLTGDKREIGYGNSDQNTPIVVPANVWTYYKLPLGSVELWKKGNNFNQIGWWIKGPDAQDETFYFDDVLLVK